MTKTYQLPEDVTSVSANGQTFHADELGRIDITLAHPGTLAALLEHARIEPVKTEEEMALEAAAQVERERFEAAVQAMLDGMKRQSVAGSEAAQAAIDLEGVKAAAEKEESLAERAHLEATAAAEPIAQVTAAETPIAAAAPGGVIPPKRAKK